MSVFRVRAVLYGGPLDGQEMLVPIEREVILVRHEKQTLAYGEAFRSARHGGAWVYAFQRCVGASLPLPEDLTQGAGDE